MAVASITETMQYLTFKLAEEVFALDITKVREVLEFSSVPSRSRWPASGCHRR
ncbi:MAG: chemotaxis protein CheW, partial [Nitrospirae bacterium]|nr:chemotaxis protein CheW [Nitrospirota bacterium]